MPAGVAFCETPSQYLQSACQGLLGGPQRGQQQSATQTLRVHLLGIDDIMPKCLPAGLSEAHIIIVSAPEIRLEGHPGLPKSS